MSTDVHELQEPGSTIVYYEGEVVDEQQEANAAIPMALAESIPPEMRIVLDSFDNEEHNDPYIADLRKIFAMDRMVAGVHPGDKTRIREIRTRQAERLERHIGRVGDIIRENEFLLGGLLIFAKERNLITYRHKSSIEEWCRELGIEPDITRKAIGLYNIWPFLADIDYTLQDLLDGTITETKAKFILGMKNKQPQELDQYTLEVLAEVRPELVPSDLEVLPENKKNDQISRIVRDLPPAEREMVSTVSFDRYAKKKREEVEKIREGRDTDVLKDQEEKMGEPEKAYFVYRVRWSNGGLEYVEKPARVSFRFPQIMAGIKNLAITKFYLDSIDGEPYEEPNKELSLSELCQILSLVASPDPVRSPQHVSIVSIDDDDRNYW